MKVKNKSSVQTIMKVLQGGINVQCTDSQAQHKMQMLNCMLHKRVHHIIKLLANGQTKTTEKIISIFLSLSCSYLHVHSYLLLLSHSLQIRSKFLSLFLPPSPSCQNIYLMAILSFLHPLCTFSSLLLFSYILSPFLLFVTSTYDFM